MNASETTESTYEIGEDELPSEAVVRATAALTDTPVLDLAPLYDVVDPDHLDGLFGTSGGRSRSNGRSVSFTFGGCHVSVTGEVVIVRLSD